jgi:hypothetical protein
MGVVIDVCKIHRGTNLNLMFISTSVLLYVLRINTGTICI